MRKMTEAQELAKKISDYLNTSWGKTDELVKELETMHPTLQQLFTRVCVGWLKSLAERKYYDGRNVASVKLAKKILQNLNEEDLRLPMI